MEYYTKSEGLGFLIRKSRIDFRIEFRGVSILCEFNPSTKTRYGHTRTHQRPLVFHDHLVSHDHHQTTLWSHTNPSTSVPLIQRFQIQMVKSDHTVELQRLQHFGWRWLKQYDCKMVLQRWVCQMSKGGFQPCPSHRKSLQRSCTATVKKTQHSIGSRQWHGPTWVMWHDHRWLSSWLSFCKRSHMTLQNCSAQSLVPTSKWYDTAETVSTMIRQTFETNISSNLHNFNPSFRFLPCRT